MAPPRRLRCRGRRRGVGNCPRRPWNPSLVSDLSQRFALCIRFSIGPRHRFTYAPAQPESFRASGPNASVTSADRVNPFPLPDAARNRRRLECRSRLRQEPQRRTDSIPRLLAQEISCHFRATEDPAARGQIFSDSPSLPNRGGGRDSILTRWRTPSRVQKKNATNDPMASQSHRCAIRASRAVVSATRRSAFG